MIDILNRQSERACDFLHAVAAEEPEVLWRRHKPPISPAEPCDRCAKIAGGDDDYATRIEMATQQAQRFARVGQMLHDIEQDKNIRAPDLGQGRLVRRSSEDTQS